MNKGIPRAELLREILPGLNALFDLRKFKMTLNEHECRTMHKYGMTMRQLQEYYDVSLRKIQTVLNKKKRQKLDLVCNKRHRKKSKELRRKALEEHIYYIGVANTSYATRDQAIKWLKEKDVPNRLIGENYNITPTRVGQICQSTKVKKK